MPRPRLKPTEEQRRLVKAMAAMDISQDRIALVIGIRSQKTLRKFFREELDRGATEAMFNMEQAQYKSGMAGNTRAQTDWFRRHKGHGGPAGPPASPAPFIVYKDTEVKKDTPAEKDTAIEKDTAVENDTAPDKDTAIEKDKEVKS